MGRPLVARRAVVVKQHKSRHGSEVYSRPILGRSGYDEHRVLLWSATPGQDGRTIFYNGAGRIFITGDSARIGAARPAAVSWARTRTSPARFGFTGIVNVSF